MLVTFSFNCQFFSCPGHPFITTSADGFKYVIIIIINLGLSNEHACNSKLDLSSTMWKKFRLPPFSFSIVIYSITCCTLLNKIHVGARFTDDAYATDFQRNDTGASKPAARYFNLPSFLQACSMQSLLHQGITELCKSLIFQIGTQNAHGINKCYSIN